MTAQVFTDQTPTATGTPLNAANLNALVVASPYVLNGTTYYPSSFSGASLSLSQPAVQAVVNNGSGGVVYVGAPSTTLTVPSSPTGTWYVDLTSSGSFTVTQAGSAASNALRLYQVTSTGTGITALFTIANVQSVPQSQVVGDLAEAATNDTIAFGVLNIQNNLNRIRFQIATIYGTGWNAAIALLDSSKNLLVSSGSKLRFPGQTGSTGGTSVANQGVGAFTIPGGTINNSTVVVPNTLITANSLVFLTIASFPSTVVNLVQAPATNVAGTSFSVAVYTSGATASGVDVHYLIVN